MRKIILGLGISMDGYIARLDGSVDFLFMPKDFSMAPFFKNIDTAIMGRKTLDVSLKMGGGSFGGSMKTYVFSRTMPTGERDGMIFTNETPCKLVQKLRKAQGKNIWLMGGGELAREFLKEDLVDEVHLGIVPVLLGEGVPLFPPGFMQLDFKLLENKSYSRGLVSLKYERKRKTVRK
jgi:dihydrofolate reductase